MFRRFTETLALIKALYAIEDEVRSQQLEVRQAIRQEKAKPIVDALHRLLTALLACSDDGGDNWAIIASLIETAKLNQVDPLAWMTNILQRLARGHSNQELDQLMPWKFKP